MRLFPKKKHRKMLNFYLSDCVGNMLHSDDSVLVTHINHKKLHNISRMRDILKLRMRVHENSVQLD